MYDTLAYFFIFPYGNDEWHCALEYNDSKGNLKNVSPMKFYSRLLFRRTCDFNILLRSGRFFQQYLCELFVKVESEWLSWLRQNQSKLRASNYNHLCELLADAATNTNEVHEWTRNRNKKNNPHNIGRLVVLPSTHIGILRYMQQKCLTLSQFRIWLVIQIFSQQWLATHIGQKSKMHSFQIKERMIVLTSMIVSFAWNKNFLSTWKRWTIWEIDCIRVSYWIPKAWTGACSHNSFTRRGVQVRAKRSP